MILYFLLLYFEIYSCANHPKSDLPTSIKSDSINSKQPVWGLLHGLDQYKRWAIREAEIFQVLRNKIENLKTTRNFIEIYLTTIRKRSNSDNLPIFKIRQLTTKLATLKNQLHSNPSLPSPTEILNLLEINSQQISSTDLFLSINSLLHPQQPLGLYPQQIAKGLEIDLLSSHGGHLNLLHMLEIGTIALFRKWYARSVEWFHFSYHFAVKLENKANQHQTLFIVDLASILFTLAIQEHNRIITQPETEENYTISINLFSRPLQEKSNQPQKIISWPPPPLILYSRKIFDRLPKNNEDMQYATLCKDLYYQTYTPYSRFTNLKCFYEKSIHAYFYINPVKTEHLSDSPPVYMYYEIVTNKLNEYLRKVKDLKVELGRTSKGTRKDMEDRSERKTSTWTGVQKGFNEDFKKLEWIGETVTGLKVSVEETLNKTMEYTVYTYGRLVGAHTDTETDKLIRYTQWQLLRNSGDRLATMLYYLQPADLGGQTSFCQGGFNVVPQKNSLLVYYHLYRNGTVRPDIDHGSCPVLHGTKIVLLAATRYLPNWRSFACSLNRNE